MKHYIHHVPGRLRVRIPSVKGSESNARTLETAFSEMRGVHSAEANPLTGSVLIHYDPSCNLDWVKALAASQARGSEGLAITAKVGRTIGKYLLETALERGVVAVLAAVL